MSYTVYTLALASYVCMYIFAYILYIFTINTDYIYSKYYVLHAFIVLWKSMVHAGESMKMSYTNSRPCFRAPYTSSTLLGCGSCELLLLDLCPHRWGFLVFVSDFFCAAAFPMNELHLETYTLYQK